MTLQQQQQQQGESQDRDPVPGAEEEEEEWMGALVGGLGLADDDNDIDDEVPDEHRQRQQKPKKPVVDKKRLRQLRSKPGWYRRVSQHVSKGAKKRIRALWPQVGSLVEAVPISIDA